MTNKQGLKVINKEVSGVPRLPEPMKQKQEILKIARSWLGTPWQHEQRIKGVAVDCINFLFAIAIESGYKIPELPKNYTRIPQREEIEAYLETNFEETTKDNLSPLNVILFSLSGLKCHVGLITEEHRIIHASMREKKVIEHNLDGVWLRSIYKVYRLKHG